MQNPIFCAIDTQDIDKARALIEKISPYVGGIKLGLEFFMAHGPDGIRKVRSANTPLFLDVKLHDISNTVAGAIRSLIPLEATYITIHASGGRAMLTAAREAAEQEAARLSVTPPKLLGVTVMTSLDDRDLLELGQQTPALFQVKNLTALIQSTKLAGVVCSPSDVVKLRAKFGPNLLLVTPGIRPAGSEAQDQKRIATPQSALKDGANVLVIGRPITEANDPADAAKQILFSLN